MLKPHTKFKPHTSTQIARAKTIRTKILTNNKAKSLIQNRTRFLTKKQVIHKMGPVTHKVPIIVVNNVKKYFPKKSIASLTKINPPQQRLIFKKLHAMPEKEFKNFDKIMMFNAKKASNQTAKHMEKTSKSIPLPFEDLMQLTVAVRYLRKPR